MNDGAEHSQPQKGLQRPERRGRIYKRTAKALRDLFRKKAAVE